MGIDRRAFMALLGLAPAAAAAAAIAPAEREAALSEAAASSLWDLRPGDSVEVVRPDGRVVRGVVDGTLFSAGALLAALAEPA